MIDDDHTMGRLAMFALVLGACGFEHRVGGPGGDDDPNSDTLIDDVAEDFKGGALADSVVHGYGAIEPVVFAYNGLLMEAYSAPLVQPGNTVSWEQLETQLAARQPTGAQLGASIDVTFAERPYGVGLGVNDNFTLVYRGEIYLPGPTTLILEGDGPSMAQIATDKSTFDFRMYDEVGVTNPTMTITPPAPGWYPIRLAVTDTTGPAVLKLTTPNGAFPRRQLRARVERPGLVVEGFDNPGLTASVGLGLAAHDLQLTYGATPYDIRLQSEDFAVRYSGQVRIDVAGTYRFHGIPDAGDQVRIWLDGKVIASAWGGETIDVAPDLVPGWYDFAVDYADLGGNARLDIAITEAPAGVPLGPIAAERLRPVVRFGKVDSYITSGTSAIPDSGMLTVSIAQNPPLAPGDAIVQSVDVAYVLAHSAVTQVSTRLLHPDGTGLELRPAGSPARPVDYFGARDAFAGKPIGGADAWRLELTDNAAAQTGSVSGIYLVLGFRAGVGPIAQQSSFISQPRALDASTLVAARVTSSVPVGSSVTFSIRSCSAADACDAEPWQPADALPLTHRGFVQYKLELASDSWAAPSVDKIEIDYR